MSSIQRLHRVFNKHAWALFYSLLPALAISLAACGGSKSVQEPKAPQQESEIDGLIEDYASALESLAQAAGPEVACNDAITNIQSWMRENGADVQAITNQIESLEESKRAELVSRFEGHRTFIASLGVLRSTQMRCDDHPDMEGIGEQLAMRMGYEKKPTIELSDDELQQLRAGLLRVRVGMSRSQVLELLGVSLEGLAQIGTGPQTEATVIYVLGHSVDLNLKWDFSSPNPVLLRAALVERPL